jgi:hypothetical protein
MSSDLIEISKLLRSGVLERHEVPTFLEMVRGCSDREPTSRSRSVPSTDLDYSATADNAYVSVNTPTIVEEKHSISTSSSQPPPSPVSPLSRSKPGFIQGTLWNHGASVKRKLPDGSTVMVYDGDGLPRSVTPGKVLCKSCLQTFPNQGALSVHIRFHHPSDEAAMNRLHSRTTSTTTNTLHTSKKNTISTVVTTTLSSEAVEVDDGPEPKKKKKRTTGASKRTRYSVGTKWVPLADLLPPSVF